MLVNKKGSKPTCLLLKVSNAHMLTISLTASHFYPPNAQAYGKIDAAEKMTLKLSDTPRRISYLPQESYSSGVNFVTLK